MFDVKRFVVAIWYEFKPKWGRALTTNEVFIGGEVLCSTVNAQEDMLQCSGVECLVYAAVYATT